MTRLHWLTALHLNFLSAAQMLPNLRVITGGAEYGITKIQRVFEF